MGHPIIFAPRSTQELGYGVKVALQILILPV